MPNITAETSSNIFYKARLAASSHNEQLSSREGAASIMAIDRGRLYRIEKGIAYPFPEEVQLMADLYNAPELRNYYCTDICPLGREMPKAEVASLDRIAIRAFFALRKVNETRELLLDITADGIIDENERSDLRQILTYLEELEQVAQSLKIWVKKNL